VVVLTLGLCGAALGSVAYGPPPSPSFSVGLSATPTQGSAPLLVAFQTTVLSGTASLYNWTFGDGLFLNATPAEGGADPYHTYTVTGNFVATVVVHETGTTTTASANVTVHVTSGTLQASATATPTSGSVPLTVQFQGSASGGTGTYVGFRWTFGDGGEGSGPDLFYTFQRPGTFHVVLNVTDADGHWATAALQVTVHTNATTGPTTPSLSVEVLAVVLVVGFVIGTVFVYFLGGWVRRRRERREPSEPSSSVPSAPSSSPASAAEVPLTPEAHAGPPEATVVPSPSAREPEPTSAQVVEPSPPATVPSSPSETMVPTGSWASPEPLSQGVPKAGGAARELAGATPPTTEVLKISERVVLHLASQGFLPEDEVAPPSFTQAGMAEALSIRQNALTNVLRRLEAAGVLTVDVRHVKGRDRRMKVYRLSARGEALARDLRARSSRTSKRP
jgi:PKD repeat protein